MATRAEFHFSWVYAFYATPRSLRIWAPVPPRETGCDTLRNCVDHLAALSHIGYPIRCKFGLLCTLIDQSKGNDSITLRFFRCPGVFAIAMVSFSSLKLLTFAKQTQLDYRKKQMGTLLISENNFYKRWRHELRHRGPPRKIAPDPPTL